MKFSDKLMQLTTTILTEVIWAKMTNIPCFLLYLDVSFCVLDMCFKYE